MELLKKLFKVIVIIGITVGLPFYPLGILITYLWFKLATFLGRTIGQLESPVIGVGSFLAPDKIFQRPNATLVHLAVLQGTPDTSTVIEHFQYIYDLQDLKESNGNSQRKYAKLGFSIEPWMGYLFWKKIDNFEIKEHIHFLHEKDMGYENVSEFVESIIRKPFKRDQSLWEIFVVTNTKINENNDTSTTNDCQLPCFVIFRTHHLLLDGISLIKLWYTADQAFKTEECHIPQLYNYSASASLNTNEDGTEQSFFQRIWRKADVLLLRSAYLKSKHVCVPGDNNCLTKCHKTFHGNWYCSGVNKIYLEKYRQPLRDLKFSLTHALLVGYSRGLDRFLETHYKMEERPQAVHIMGSVPRPNYPLEETLTNHWAIMRYKADLTLKTLKEQLEYSKKEYSRAVKHIIPEAFELNCKYVSSHFPVKLGKFLWNTKKSGTLSLSNIPGPPTPQRMFGLPVMDRVVWLPLTGHNSGIGLLLLTYNGWGTISMTADSGCIPNKRLFQKLNNIVMEEMQFVLDEVVEMARNIDQNENLVKNQNPSSHNDPVYIDSDKLSEVKVV